MTVQPISQHPDDVTMHRAVIHFFDNPSFEQFQAILWSQYSYLTFHPCGVRKAISIYPWRSDSSILILVLQTMGTTIANNLFSRHFRFHGIITRSGHQKKRRFVQRTSSPLHGLSRRTGKSIVSAAALSAEDVVLRFFSMASLFVAVTKQGLS